MRTDEWIQLIDHLKWPVALLLGGSFAALLLRAELAGLLASLRARKIRIGNAEVSPEQTPQQTQSIDILSTANNPATGLGVLEASDSPYFRSRMAQLDEQISKLSLPPVERHRWMIREGAAILLQLDFERVYRAVWESQMELLASANTVTGALRSDVQAYYDRVATTAPDVHGNDTIDRWYGFLVASDLIEVRSERFHTTEKGKLFLQYIIQQGLPMHGLYRGR